MVSYDFFLSMFVVNGNKKLSLSEFEFLHHITLLPTVKPFISSNHPLIHELTRLRYANLPKSPTLK